jgi:hypothetical protein
VVENLGIMDGLQRGWEVVRNNIGEMIVMWLILNVGISFVVGFIIALPFIVIAGPALVALITQRESVIWTGMIISLICLVAYLPALILLSGMLRSYIETGWTLTFLRLTNRPMISAEVSSEPIA